MLTAKAEAVQRLPLPFASPNNQAADKMFADLLRHLDGRPRPAPASPPEEKPRPVKSKRADEPRPPKEKAAADAPAAERKSGTAERERIETAQSGDVTAPAGSGDAPSDRQVGMIAPAPASDSTGSANPPQAATATAGNAAEPPAPVAAVIPVDLPIPAGTAALAPAPAAGMPTPPPAGTTEPVASSSSSATGATPPPTPTVPAVPLETATATATPAGRQSGGESAPPAPATQPDILITDPADALTSAGPAGDGDADVVLRTERSPAPALAQGLGKLGAGAEVAIAAQAIGATMQNAAPGQVRKDGTAAPQGPTAPAQPRQDGNPAAPQAATGTATPAAVVAAAPVVRAAAPGLVPATDGMTGDEAFDPIGSISGPGQRSATAAHAAHASATLRGTAHATPAEQVAVHIQRAVSAGASRITVQLKPAELGSIEIQLDFAPDGRVSASILADRAETLDLLQRDARVLERSLQDAGLKADSGSLSFDLRGGGRQDQGSPQTAARNVPEKTGAEPRLAAASETTRPAATATAEGGVDIRV